jgi:methionyl-tRNA formyltransferase
MRDNLYIVASSKSWNSLIYDDLKVSSTGRWVYAENPAELQNALFGSIPRYIFFLHWNWIVPETIWHEHECVCFHMTDLPYGRGGSPLQNLILTGHTETKLTALRMIQEMDAGPIYSKRPLSLNGSAEEIYVRASKLSVELIRWIIEDNPQPIPQEGEVIIFKRRKPEQSNLPVNGGLMTAYDFIRMLDADGYPNAFVEHGDYRINFKNARFDNEHVFAEVEIKLKNKS